MIFKLTEEEKAELEEIAGILRTDNGDKAAALENTDYIAALKRFDDFDKRVQLRFFDSFSHDRDTLLNLAKDQTKKIIETDKAFKAMTDPAELSPATPEESFDYIVESINLILNELKDDPTALEEIRKNIISELKAAGIIHETKTGNIEQISESKMYFVIKSFGMMNDKANAIMLNSNPDMRVIDGQLKMIWSANQAPEKAAEVLTFVALTYQGAKLANKNITAFDDAVQSAVSTIAHYQTEAGAAYPITFTPEQVWRVMNGIRDSRQRLSAKQIQRITDSINKLRFTNIYIDRSDEIKKFNYKLDGEEITEAIIDDYVINAARITFKTKNGKEANGYVLRTEPPLYRYNREKNHLLYVPYDLLNVSETTGISGYTIEIRNYLLRQIELMYNGVRDNKSILFETLYRESGIKQPESRVSKANYSSENAYLTAIRKEKAGDRKKVTDILTAWKNKKYINGFSIKSAGKNYSIVIILNPAEIQRRKISPLTAENQITGQKSA